MTVFKHIDCTSNAFEETTEEATPEELGERIVDDTGYVQYMRRICPCISTLFIGGGETIILLLKSINFNT